MRARLAILAGGRQCELRGVVLRDKPRALLEASPKATVPVLVDARGVVIDQSLDIMLWALERRDPLSWLTPPSGGLPGMLALLAQCDGNFKHHLDRYKYPQRYCLDDGRGGRDQASAWLAGLEARRTASAFLFGDRARVVEGKGGAVRGDLGGR